MVTGVVFKALLLILVVTSMAGWLIFTAGFGIFWKILSPRNAPLPTIIGVSWTSVLSPMILFGSSAIPLYPLAIARIFISRPNLKRICSALIMFINFLYMLGLGTTGFSLSLLLVGGLGDYLKSIFMLTQKHILVMAIGALVSVLPYWAYLVLWPLSQIKRKESPYIYRELTQN